MTGVCLCRHRESGINLYPFASGKSSVNIIAEDKILLQLNGYQEFHRLVHFYISHSYNSFETFLTAANLQENVLNRKVSQFILL